VSLTLGFETHSIVEGEAVSTLLSSFTIDAIFILDSVVPDIEERVCA
jgi:hypothetical protein